VRTTLFRSPFRRHLRGRTAPPRWAAAAFAAVTIAGAVAPADAGAQVMYRRVDVTTGPNGIGPVYVNFLTGGTLVGALPSCPGPACNFDLGFTYAGRAFWSLLLPDQAGVDPSPVPPAERGVVGRAPSGAPLGPGDEVGAASAFGTGASTLTEGRFDGQLQFFGVRFRNEAAGTVHYGWARLGLFQSPQLNGTFVDYAFEQTPGRAITVGAGLPDASVVPEPSTGALAAGGLLLAAAAGRRARRGRGA
jgi:hypothetical protein